MTSEDREDRALSLLRKLALEEHARRRRTERRAHLALAISVGVLLLELARQLLELWP